MKSKEKGLKNLPLKELQAHAKELKLNFDDVRKEFWSTKNHFNFIVGRHKAMKKKKPKTKTLKELKVELRQHQYFMDHLVERGSDYREKFNQVSELYSKTRARWQEIRFEIDNFKK
jgi:signal recognition particle subunit SEC65